MLLKYKFFVPLLPPSTNELERMHRCQRSRVRAKYYSDFWYSIYAQIKQKPKREKIKVYGKVTFVFSDKRGGDKDNREKTLQDALKMCGFIYDDRPSYWHCEYPEPQYSKKNPGVKIELYMEE